MISPSFVKRTLTDLINEAASNPSPFVNNPEKDMSRNRKCNFKDTTLLILGFTNNSLNTEISQFFVNPKERVVKSSFVKQRAKINDTYFPHLFTSFNKIFPGHKKYKGFALRCCDGSDLNLPAEKNDTVNSVLYPNKEGTYYQKHLNALYDPLNGRFQDVVIQPRPEFREAAALCTMVCRYESPHPTIFMADRGYQSFNLMATIIESNQFYLIRAKDLRSSSSFLKHISLPVEGEFDIDVTFGITRSRKKEYVKHPEKYKVLHKNRDFDFIDKNDYESVYTMSIRIVCVEIGEGIYEYLLTNLPRNKFSTMELKELYNIRWKIETAFRSIKYAFCMVYFHSRKRAFIDQEIYARLIMYNFASIIHSIAEKELEKQKGSPKRKWKQKLSFDASAEVARKFLRGKMTNKTIIALLLTYKSPIRPGRMFYRDVKSRSVKPLNNRA